MNWMWDRTVLSYLASGVAHVAALATMHTVLSRNLPNSFAVRDGVNSLALIATIETQLVQEAAIEPIVATAVAAGDVRTDEQLAAQTREIVRADTEDAVTNWQVRAEFESHHPASRPQRTAVAEQLNRARACLSVSYPAENLSISSAQGITPQPVNSQIIPRQVAVPAQPAVSSQAAMESIFAVGELQKSPPRPRYNPAPLWPVDLLAARLSGVVYLRVRVGADGSVLNCSVHRSSGFSAFDQAAMAAMRRWQFEPAERFGRAIETEILHPIRFQIVEE